MGFSRQEYWSGLPFPSPGDLPNPGIKPRSSALQTDSLPSELSGKPSIEMLYSRTLLFIYSVYWVDQNVHSGFSVWSYEKPEPTRVSLLAQMVENLPTMQKTRVWSLGQEGPLEKGLVTHSSILAWRIPPTEEPGGLLFTGLQRVRHDWGSNTYTSFRYRLVKIQTEAFSIQVHRCPKILSLDKKSS